MATMKELIEQRDALELAIQQARQSEITGAVEKVKELVQTYGLTSADVFGSGKVKAPKEVSKVAPKYRDPATSLTWTGRGKPPRWIAGKDRTEFAI